MDTVPLLMHNITLAATAENQMLMADNSTNPVFNFQSTASPHGQIPFGAQPVSYSLPDN